MEEDGKKTKKTKGIILILGCIVLFSIFYAVTQGKWLDKIRSGSQGKTEASTAGLDHSQVLSFGEAGKALFRTYGKSFLMCTKDGVKFYKSVKESVWNDTFTMSSPSLQQEGEFTAVADVLGRTVNVYNKKGPVYKLTTESPILRFSLNPKGYLSLILTNETDYTVMAYNERGETILERREQDQNVYPLASDISNDGKMLAVSYVDASDIAISSKILFFYLTKKDGDQLDNIDKMFAAIQKKDMLIPYMQFMDGNILAAVSDVGMLAADGSGKELWYKELENKIDLVGFTKDQIVIAGGKEFPGKEGERNGVLSWYDLQGKRQAKFEVGETITYMNAAEEGVVIGRNNVFTALNQQGKVIWTHKAVADVAEIAFADGVSKVYYITNTTAEYVDLEKNKGQTIGESSDYREEQVQDQLEPSQDKMENISNETDVKTEPNPETGEEG